MPETSASPLPFVRDLPWSDRLTDDDRAHLVTYLRILDAQAVNASTEDIARFILELDPQRDPEMARTAVERFARRAAWLTENSHLLKQRQPPAAEL
ncbi:MAG: DUF2285 domain-containing protein [Alphaproteobacteria bacterium]|nr:DUF2285 domain-containing protein [Alphaproteobacteria bacterium]